MSQRAPPPQPYNLQPRITQHLSPSMPTDDSFIDPALRALPTSASASRQTAGTKRRARGEATTKSPTTASTSRVTRRSAAAAAAPSQNDLAEPSRGEEENLIGYGSSKRTKLNSSTHARTTSNTDNDDGLKTSTPPESSVSIQHKLHPALRSLGYPFGLTPFRYPCLTPNHPPPPPGDPKDPNLQRFDPADISATSKVPSLQRTTVYPEIWSGSSSVNGNDGTQYLSMADYMSSDTNDVAFQSLTALLAASQEYGPPGTTEAQNTNESSLSRG